MSSKNGFFSVFTALGLFWALGSCPVFGADWKTLPGHVPHLIRHLVANGELPADNQLRLAIGLPLRDPSGLDKFLAEVADPCSPNFRHYLSPEEFTARFGPSEADYAAVKNFARANGLEIVATHGNRLVLDVSGRVANVEQAFHLRLQKFPHPTEAREFFAPDVEPSVAGSLPVADVSGLSDYARPHSKILHSQSKMFLSKTAPKSGSGAGGDYFGNDFRNAYAPGTTLTGAGQMVGLLQFDGFYSNDIAAYENQLPGQPSVPIQTVLLDGFSGTPVTGPNSANDEVSLDIEMAIAMAPGLAKIVVFEAGPNGFQNDILNAMVANPQIKQFSCSWGWSGGPSVTTENIFKQMIAQGQCFFNASGDSGAFTPGADSVNGVDNASGYLANAPSSSPNITQVGGTSLAMNGSGDSYASETVWNDGGGTGSSGGISSYFSIPAWQQGINMTANGGSTTQRNIPDVAMIAEDVYVNYGNGNTGLFTGTSIAAPLWAAFMALVNQQAAAAGNPSAGFINPAIYALGHSADNQLYFHDITTGNNSWSGSPNEYPATTGYDLCTGWGTPNGTNLINALAGFNLSAHLADVTPPAVSIIDPINNSRWSNTLFTITGSASDNVAVSNVFYSLNDGAWTSAATKNNDTNWTADVTLTPGTNIVQAYAEDASGNFSKTNRANVICILTAPLTLITNGLGNVSLNANQPVLLINASYALTAKAATGFKFSNWTDGLGNIVTNSPTLLFSMASNLVFAANFVDITSPTNLISTPLANQHWSNSLFTISGRAGDNVAVSNVFYSINGTNWQVAYTTNKWASWTADVWLASGSNVIQAYSQDASGNVSATNLVSLDYIVSAPLIVTTNGRGSIGPSYNGGWLQIGASYTLTATAANGFKFANWTDASANILTNGSALKFQMQSNLAFTANFFDIARPANTITAPVANQRWSNSLITVTGKAVDNVAVSNVFCALNQGEWTPASTTNGWTNWSTGLVLTPGTNLIQAYAVDGTGNVSPTNSVSMVYVLNAPLRLGTNGRGSISLNFNKALLQIGANYTLVATPAAGFKFTGWTDAGNNLVTNGVTLKFMMASNLFFAANFVDNTRPTLSIANPVSNEKWSNYMFAVSGQAGDNVGVTGVFYSVNGSDWLPAGSVNNWTNWYAQINLVPGTNTIVACAIDAAGNISTTNKVSFVFVFAMGGLWNMVQLQTPAQLSWDSVNGLIGGTSFGATNGTITFNSDGTLNGQFEEPFTGTYSQGSNGLVAATIVTSGSTNAYNLSINSRQDTITLVDGELSATDDSQEVILFQRAPLTNTISAMAGSWNILQLQTPAQMFGDITNGFQGGNNYATTNGTMVLNANGTVTGNLGGIFTGSYSVSSNGIINLVTVDNTGQTNDHTLFVNASRNTMALVEGELAANDNQQELIVFQRAPVTVLATDLTGRWNLAEFATPSQVAGGITNGLVGGMNFGTANGFVNFNPNGTASGNLDGAITGTYIVGAAGKIQLNFTNGSETNSCALFINASKDAMVGTQNWNSTNMSQQIFLLQR